MIRDEDGAWNNSQLMTDSNSGSSNYERSQVKTAGKKGNGGFQHNTVCRDEESGKCSTVEYNVQ